MLASIQKVIDVAPIPNADLIEKIGVLGWSVVAKKDEFKPGDWCIFIEIDTILPRTDWSEFLFKHPEDTKYRLRTIKLKKQISQGLVLRPQDVNLAGNVGGNKDTFTYFCELGEDVSEFLGITKFEKPIPVQLRGTVKGKFPSFLRKTDEVRIQSEPKLLEQLQGKPYYITQKMDGTSATFYNWKGVFGVCSRNLEMKNPYDNPKERFKYLWDMIRRFLRMAKQRSKQNPRTFNLNVYWKMAEKYNIKEWLLDGYAIQAEICGPSIQGNKMGLVENEMFIFNLWDINKQEYIYPKNEITLDFGNFVPVIKYGEIFPETNIEDLLDLAKGVYKNETPHEGIVIRAIDQSVSFKVVNNEFLLKYSE